MTYIVIYNVNVNDERAGDRRNKLDKVVRDRFVCRRVAAATWLVKASKEKFPSATDIKRHLSAYLNKKDTVFIAEVTGNRWQYSSKKRQPASVRL